MYLYEYLSLIASANALQLDRDDLQGDKVMS